MDNKKDELVKKEKEYTEYIEEHRGFVKEAFLKFISSNISDLTSEEIEILRIAVDNHDLSKYETEEFDAYRKHFFPCTFENPKDSQKEFEIALKHHYSLNDHHPQNISRKNGLNKVACIHNILDWIGMSYKFKDDVWKFYEGSNIKEKINDEERIYIENILEEMKMKEDIFYSERDDIQI